MNLHEYQGKEILAKHGVRIQRGYIAETVDQAIANANRLFKDTETPCFLIKAQVHAGGRGKGGGIKLAKNIQKLWEEVSSNQTLTWRHVRAHRGHKWNERADHLAIRAVQKKTPEPLSFWKPGMR